MAGGELQTVTNILAVERLIFEFLKNAETPGVGECFESTGETVDILTVFLIQGVDGIKENSIVQVGCGLTALI